MSRNCKETKTLKLLRNATDQILRSVESKIPRRRKLGNDAFPAEFSTEDKTLLRDILENELSMVPLEGLCSTLAAAKYVCESGIEGDFVECGVWRGGNAVIAAEIFRRYNSSKRVFLFDTFEGMTEPTSNDMSLSDGRMAIGQFLASEKGSYNEWCFASQSEVRSAFSSRDLLSESIVFVKGPVETTLRLDSNLPERISLLRLDTDWYESTKLELEVLFPRLSVGGCLIVDDYGYWSGAKKATDEFFAQIPKKPLFHVTDRSRRIAVKI